MIKEVHAIPQDMDIIINESIRKYLFIYLI
jgi:hypothetical protein